MRLEKFIYFLGLRLPLQTEGGIFERSVVLALSPSPELNVERDACQPMATPLLKTKINIEVGGRRGGKRALNSKATKSMHGGD